MSNVDRRSELARTAGRKNAYGFLKAVSELVVSERAESGAVARIAGVQGAHSVQLPSVDEQLERLREELCVTT